MVVFGPDDLSPRHHHCGWSSAHKGAPLMAGGAPVMRRGIPWGFALFSSSQFFLFLCLFAIVDSAELLRPVPKNGICKSVDIRNDVRSFEQLADCQVIEGSLQILLFDNVNETHFTNISFPGLVEITDYLMLFRVTGLKSVGQLFPNLSVIRGQNLFLGGHSLVIFEMPSLQEIGLHSLTKIMNGVVYVDKNPSLCFVHSIDWNKILNVDESNISSKTSFLKSFKPENECPVCPSEVNGKSCPRNEKDSNKFLCWNRNHCQKICTGCGNRACNEKEECCDERCVGGCGTNITQCTACKEFVLITGEDKSSMCVQKCPNHFLAYLQRRCVTSNECINMTRPIDFDDDLDSESNKHPYMIHNGSCVLQCPPNYAGNYTDHSCKKCNNTCRKECPGARIDSINLAAQLRGCTHITGSVEIQIRGGEDVVKALQQNLEMIEEIDDYLKVVRSFSLVSLNFFKNLKRIRGKNLESGRYSFVVLDNPNLQDLFDWNTTHKDFKIDNGSLYFHFNPKLCINKIEELKRIANLPPYTELDVAPSSNGDKVACQLRYLEVDITSISSRSATLEWRPFELDDARKLLSYIVYSIEAPMRNVNFFDGRDACGKDNWHVDDVANNMDSDRPIRHNLTDLKPFTQYAFFVKTYTIATEKHGAQSKIKYFPTRPAQPSEPSKLHANSYSSDSLNIIWSSPSNPNGIISYYIVTGVKQKHTATENRDYCVHSVTQERPKKISTVPPKTKPQDCNGTKDKLNPILIDEQEEIARIDFENALHNKVYIKRTSVNRNRRDVSDIIDKDTVNASIPEYKPQIPEYIFPKNVTLLPNLDKLIVPNTTEPDGKTWETFTFFVKVPLQSLQVQNLHHYTVYSIAVRACRDMAEDDQEPVCGEPSEITATTLQKTGADNIYNVTILNTTSDSVTIQWEQPRDPNRMIVSYAIWYRPEGTKNQQYNRECISFKDFKNYSRDSRFMVYTLPIVYPGNHSLYLRASSLFGPGDPSKILTFYIPESGPDAVLIISLVLFFVFLGIIAAVWYLYRKTMREKYLMRLIPAVNPDYMPSVYVVDDWEVPRKNIELIKELGQGSFGMVWEGIGHDFKDVSGILRCAVKTVNEHATSRERVDFLNEASVMKAFNTTHVVRLLGVVSQGQPALVIMELMVNGDLKSYLRSHRPENNDGKSPPSLKQILQMAIEIADGMAYLEGKKFVHRDLAARNCMVAEDLTVKIGDFGMTRDIYETDYYRKGSRGLLPVRWMSPESLKDGVFSSSSDAWSYGVVLWEMATLASQPYQGLSNEQVLRYIMEGGMMERPENCPDKLYEVMRLCWDLKPGRRPTFMKLCEMLLPEANENFGRVSFFHSEEGAEVRAIRAAASLAAEVITGEAGEGDDADASTPLNALPPDMRIVGAYAMSASERSDSIHSVHVDPNPRFYSISEDRTANGFVAGAPPRNGKAQSQC